VFFLHAESGRLRSPVLAARCAQFACVDIDDAASLAAALRGADLVVHTAGPFQRKQSCGVLEAAIETRTPYMDVCDDADYSRAARGFHAAARAAGVPAITTAGARCCGHPACISRTRTRTHAPHAQR
jgi:saccharopine dehydrogenase-like NADP-dependent oxidoreductase